MAILCINSNNPALQSKGTINILLKFELFMYRNVMQPEERIIWNPWRNVCWKVRLSGPHPCLLVPSILTKEHTTKEFKIGPSPHSVPELSPNIPHNRTVEEISPIFEESWRTFTDNLNAADQSQCTRLSPISLEKTVPRNTCAGALDRSPPPTGPDAHPPYSDPKGSSQMVPHRRF